MPTTTVVKTIGAISILTSLMKPSPSGFIAAPCLGPRGAEEHAERDADQHLDVEAAEHRDSLPAGSCRGDTADGTCPHCSVWPVHRAARTRHRVRFRDARRDYTGRACDSPARWSRWRAGCPLSRRRQNKRRHRRRRSRHQRRGARRPGPTGGGCATATQPGTGNRRRRGSRCSARRSARQSCALAATSASRGSTDRRTAAVARGPTSAPFPTRTRCRATSPKRGSPRSRRACRSASTRRFPRKPGSAASRATSRWTSAAPRLAPSPSPATAPASGCARRLPTSSTAIASRWPPARRSP